VAENLRTWKTGALRRLSVDKPLPDAIPSGRTPKREEAIADHPCLKPQHFMRILVRSLLPLGEGTVLDPFLGAGSTVAAADAVGYDAVGVELDAQYFTMAQKAIPRLAALYPGFHGQEFEGGRNVMTTQIESLEKTAKNLAEQNDRLSKQLELRLKRKQGAAKICLCDHASIAPPGHAPLVSGGVSGLCWIHGTPMAACKTPRRRTEKGPGDG
jgi:hypothetical protein